ncbi:cation diffusion facilitator family transporter [Anaerotardibacter muris]|uniref:cation diffusion facilitator family transporter n=1 Tax=Anaerotardibacter muris TaxID=2941505 RepID=UPI002040FA90|nr:cation diffusion facilitator family transporter [Anaerotardibacter muris]
MAALSSQAENARTQAIKRVLLGVLLLNLAVALAKFIYGTISHSAAMQADGIHSIFDSAGNVVGLIGISLAMRPADRDHPYGHFKLETFASLIIGLMLIFAAYQVGSSAVVSLVQGSYHTEVTPISFIVMVGTLIVNVGVTTYERRMGNRLKSDILKADAAHTLSDALVSIGVIVGLILVACGIEMADDIMALVVMVAILLTAFDIFKNSFATLADGARIPEEEVRELVESIDGVREAHEVRTRGLENEIYLDLHVLVDPNMTVQASHQLVDHIESVISDAYPEVQDILIHVEPDDEAHREFPHHDKVKEAIR